MSSEICYMFLCIWEGSRAAESQTMPLCKEVDPYRKNLWFHMQGQKGRVEVLTGPTNGNHYEEDDANQHKSKTDCSGWWMPVCLQAFYTYYLCSCNAESVSVVIITLQISIKYLCGEAWVGAKHPPTMQLLSFQQLCL